MYELFSNEIQCFEVLHVYCGVIWGWGNINTVLGCLASVKFLDSGVTTATAFPSFSDWLMFQYMLLTNLGNPCGFINVDMITLYMNEWTMMLQKFLFSMSTSNGVNWCWMRSKWRRFQVLLLCMFHVDCVAVQFWLVLALCILATQAKNRLLLGISHTCNIHMSITEAL